MAAKKEHIATSKCVEPERNRTSFGFAIAEGVVALFATAALFSIGFIPYFIGFGGDVSSAEAATENDAPTVIAEVEEAVAELNAIVVLEDEREQIQAQTDENEGTMPSQEDQGHGDSASEENEKRDSSSSSAAAPEDESSSSTAVEEEASPTSAPISKPSASIKIKNATVHASTMTAPRNTVQSDNGKAERKEISRTIHTADKHIYTITVSYDETAMIPDGAELLVTEYVQEPSDSKWREDPKYKNRPLATESFKSKDYLAEHAKVLAKGLGVRDEEVVLSTKFIEVELNADGKVIDPAADVTVTIETDTIDQKDSDAIEVALLVSDDEAAIDERVKEADSVTDDGKVAKALEVDNETSAVDDEVGKPAAKAKKTKFGFATKRLGEIGISSVVQPKQTVWQAAKQQVEVLGPRSLAVTVNDLDSNEFAALNIDQKMLGAYAFGIDGEKDYGTNLWVRAIANDDTANRVESMETQTLSNIVAYQVSDKKQIVHSNILATKNSFMPLDAHDGLVLARNPQLRTTYSAMSVDEQESDQGESAINIVSEEPKAGILTQSVISPDGKAYNVELHYGAEAGIVEGASLQVRELSGIERSLYEKRANQASGLEATSYARGFDIVVADSFGRKIEPASPVSVSITLADAPALQSYRVVHFGAGSTDVIDPEVSTTISCNTFDFIAESFSVYMVVATTLEQTQAESDELVLTFDKTVRGTEGDKEASYPITIASSRIEAGTSYSYTIKGVDQADDLTANEDGKLSFVIKDGQDIAIKGLKSGSYTITEALPDKMGLKYKIGNATEVQAEDRSFTVELNKNTIVSLINARQYTVTNLIANNIETATVLHGDSYTYVNTNNTLVGVYVFNEMEVVTEGVEPQVEDDHVKNVVINNVTGDYDIYGVYDNAQAGDDYTFVVAVDGKWLTVNRTIFSKIIPSSGNREAFLDAYLHAIYAKFYNPLFNNREEYAFGHNGSNTTTSYNRKSMEGKTTFFLTNNNNMPHYLMYTPYVAANGNGEEINFGVSTGSDNFKRNNFHTVTLSDDVRRKFTSEELSDTVITGTDVAGGFPLNSIDSDDFIGVGDINPNVFGFYGRNLTVTVKVPAELMEKKADGSLSGKVTEKLMLKGVTDSSVVYDGSYSFDGAGATYTFDIPTGALTQPFKVESDPIEKGQVNYQYVDPKNSNDDLQHIAGLEKVNASDKWQEGYKTWPAYSFASYTSDKKYVYTFDTWIDLDGTKYPVDTAIGEPDTYLQLRPDWQCKATSRTVQVEYYNLLLDAEYSVKSENVYFTDSVTYTVLPMAEDLFYQQSAGQRFRFNQWRTDAGDTVAANSEIDLRDFSLFPPGDYEVLKLTAAWLPTVDPWNLKDQKWVIVSDRFSADGYSADRRYLAMKPDKGSTAVNYNVYEGTCIIREDMPELWTFEPRDNELYYVKSNTGEYLHIDGSNNLSVGKEPQEIEILYNDSLKRYVFRKMDGSNSVLLCYNNSSKEFNAVKRDYSATSNNDNNGRNSRFLLAKPKGSVKYTYPAYDGSYPEDIGKPNGSLTYSLPTTNIDEWVQDYTIKKPTQSAYYVENKDYRWNYTFDHWEVVKSDSSKTVANVGDEVTDEPLPPLTLKAVWKFESREPTPIKVEYVIERYGRGDNTTNNNDYYPRDWSSVPRVTGMSMIQSKTDHNRTYTGEDVAVKDSVTAYTPKNLTGDYYITVNGIKYVFQGWKVGGTDTPPEHNLIAANDPPVDLTELDTNGDKTVELHTVWTTEIHDPWGINGKEYMIVLDKDNNNHFAMGATACDMGLEKYDVGKEDPSIPVYIVTEKEVKWLFTAQNDGTYVISTEVDDVRRYLKMESVAAAKTGAELSLVESPSEATKLYLYQYDTTYVIGFAVTGTNYKSMLDCNQNNRPVIMWVYGKSAGNQSNKFTLGIPKPVSAVYSYPAFADKYPEGVDAPPTTGTTNNLPATHVERIVDNHYPIAAPKQKTYYVRNDIYQWNYEFKGWKVNESGNLYRSDDHYDYNINSGTGLKLEAVWKFKERVEIKKTIRYDFAFAKTPASVPELSKPTLQGGYEESISGETLRKPYEVAKPTTDWYKAAVTEDSSPVNVYQFMGWKDESGNLIDSAFIKGIFDAKYDKNEDNVITLTAVWNNTYSEKNNDNKTTREAEFFVSTVAVSADAFDDEVAISTNKNDFTRAMHFTLMQPQNMKAPDTANNSAYDNQKNFVLVGYEDKTKVNIGANDELIRQLATPTGLEKDGNVYSMMTFPDDQEVLDYLKVQDKAKLTLDGVEVDPVDITTDNFTIRWYVCKYQNDGLWHIDGKLTPNLSYLRVTKTFLGDEEALQNIPSNFEINVKSSTQSEAGIINNVNKTDIHLTLNDQRSNQQKYGRYSGTATNGSYGYIEKTGNTYVWLVPVARGAKFDITENNYTVVADNITYGIAAQYSISNSQSGSDMSRTPWFGTINDGIYSSTYPRTAIDVSDTSNIQSVDLFNTYVETGTFVIQKIDAGLDGTGSTPMPGVEFEVYDITEGNEKPVALTHKWNANTGRYNLLDYDPSGLQVSGDPQTGSDGCIYLRLAAPPDYEGTSERVFKIVEQVPGGYLKGEEEPYFEVTVDKDGVFTIGEQLQKPAGDHGKIEVLKTSVAGGSEEHALVSGVTIYNQPKPVAISVGKIWDSVNQQDSVTLQLTGDTGGTTRVSKSVDLNAGNSSQGNGNAEDSAKEWVYTLPGEFPMTVGNVKVNYSIEETKIGAYAAGSAAFSNWTQTYATTYYDENGGKIDDYQESPSSYGKLSLQVLNEDRAKDFIKTKVFKVDESGGNHLSGAEFELYRELRGAQEKITFNGEYKYVIDAGSLKFTDSNRNTGIPLDLEFGKTYYFRETKTPDGYDSRTNGYIQIEVDTEGQVTLAHDTGSGEGGWKDDDAVFTFKNNDSGTREATLKIKNRRNTREFKFSKINGFGEPLSGATFKLFKSYAFNAGTKEQTLAESENIEATSADEGAKNSQGDSIDKGVVLFEKAPQGIHFMLESDVPDGYVKTTDGAVPPAIYTQATADSAPEKAVGSAPTVYVVLLGEEALKIPENKTGTPWADVLAGVTDGDIANQTGKGAETRNYAIFQIDPDTGRAVTTPDIATYGIMNISTSQREVILKKINNAYTPLAGARFQILRYDRTLVKSTDINGNTETTFTSGDNGVYFIDKLPYGTYYLHETTVPAGYSKLEGSNDNWYSVTVDANGVSTPKHLSVAP